LASGTTTIVNAAMEPEIPALAEWLNRCGAKITGAGTSEIIIHGVKRLHPQPVEIIPDRIETGSFVILAVATRSPLRITHCRPDHLEVPLHILRQMGVKIKTSASEIQIVSVPKQLKPVDIFTHEYPGFPTDMQAPMTVLLTQAKGESRVTESLFDGRLLFTDQLSKMGTHITLSGAHTAFIKGPTPLVGRRLESPDLRAGLAFVIAALIAKGETQLDNAYMIDRGYESLEHRLKKIGANIQRISYERT
ncbi:MAG: UDP-N-acetylglucosamine 1-carboxyvinyltransferase, partial [Patescibacteria group bacterium]